MAVEKEEKEQATGRQEEIAELQGQVIQLQHMLNEVLNRVETSRTRLGHQQERIEDVEKLINSDNADARLSSVEKQIKELGKDVFSKTSSEMARLRETLQKQGEEFRQYREATESKLDMLCKCTAALSSLTPAPQQAIAAPARPVASTAAPASPAFSDAPPTRTLASFSSPSSPRVMTPVASARMASPAPVLALSSRRSPRKVSSNGNIPALALPSHMVQRVSPAKSPARAQQQQQQQQVATPQPQPASPARPVIASLGKHARESNASDLSVTMQPVRATPSPRQSSARDLEVSASKDSGHIRKRARVSEASALGDEDQDDHDSFASVEGDTTFDEASQMLDGEASFVRSRQDYIVATKTGDEVPRPVSLSAKKAPATFDPSFFATAPSLGTSFAPRSPSAGGASRKSLPMVSLPFPLVSPFNASRTARSVHGTPATTRGALGDASNAFRTSTMVPPTPPAVKTMYGTERLGDDADEEEGSRFDDFGGADLTSSRKSSGAWSGLFA